MKDVVAFVSWYLIYAIVAAVAATGVALAFGLAAGVATHQPDPVEQQDPVEQCVEEALAGARTFTEDEIADSGAWDADGPQTVCAYVVGIEE